MTLNANLRALAPKLISYQCELSTLIAAIEVDSACTNCILRFANRRKAETDSAIDSVHHAVIFLGLIDVKQFLFGYILLNTRVKDRAPLIKLLARAKITATLFATTGPLNKDLVFVATMLTDRKHLRLNSGDSYGSLFNLNQEQRLAIKNLDFGLRDSLKKTLSIESKGSSATSGQSDLDPDLKELYDDAVYWAGSVLNAIC